MVTGAGSRLKGINYERKLARLFKSQRNYENLPGAILGVDIITDKFNIQAKRGKRYCSVNKYFELPSDPTRIGLLIQKADHCPDMVTLKLEDFMELIDGKTQEEGQEAQEAYDSQTTN